MRSKRPDSLEFPIYPFPKLGGVKIAGTFEIYVTIKLRGGRIIYREILFCGYLCGGSIRSALQSRCLPCFIEIVQYLGESLFELEAAAVLDYLPEVKGVENKRIVIALLKGVGQNQRVLVKGARTGHGNVTKLV